MSKKWGKCSSLAYSRPTRGWESGYGRAELISFKPSKYLISGSDIVDNLNNRFTDWSLDICDNLDFIYRLKWICLYLAPRGRGLVERWVRGCAAQIGCFFGLSGLPLAPFYLKIGLDIGCIFAKYIIFNKFSFSLPIGCQVLMHANLHGRKYWLALKKGPSRNKWFRHRSQICVFSGLVIGWWSKLWAAHPYPTQSWVPRVFS